MSNAVQLQTGRGTPALSVREATSRANPRWRNCIQEFICNSKGFFSAQNDWIAKPLFLIFGSSGGKPAYPRVSVASWPSMA